MIVAATEKINAAVQFLADKKHQRRKKMGINFRELKITIFRENKLSRILQNRIFRGIKLSRICQNSRKLRKFPPPNSSPALLVSVCGMSRSAGDEFVLPHYFLPLKYSNRKKFCFFNIFHLFIPQKN